MEDPTLFRLLTFFVCLIVSFVVVGYAMYRINEPPDN